MRIPSVPPAATQPVDSRSSYLNRSISPSATFPIVSALATEDPDRAANPPQPMTVALASPPRYWPISAYAAS